MDFFLSYRESSGNLSYPGDSYRSSGTSAIEIQRIGCESVEFIMYVKSQKKMSKYHREKSKKLKKIHEDLDFFFFFSVQYW